MARQLFLKLVSKRQERERLLLRRCNQQQTARGKIRKQTASKMNIFVRGLSKHELLYIHSSCLTKRNLLRLNNIQEPQKNRAPENLEKGVDMSITYFVKNQSFEGSNHFGEPKKCFVTSSGKFIAVVSKSSVNVKKAPPKEEDPRPSGSKNPQRASPKIVHRSASNGSVPSTILIKRQLKKLKSQLSRKKHRNEMRVIRSKSATEIVPKLEKASQNRKGKNPEKVETSAPVEKKHKEGKSEFFKRLEAQFLMLARSLGMVDTSTTSYSYSELLATVDLEKNPGTPTKKKWPENPNENQIIMYSAANQRSREKRHKHRKKKSFMKECREQKKRLKLEEKCRRLSEGLEGKPRKKRKPKEKPPKIKKVRHYHHQRCRSCLLIHPWHPPCKKKPPKSKLSFHESNSSDEKNYSSNTEYSSSAYSRKSLSYHDEPETRQCCVDRKFSAVARDSMDQINRYRKPKERSGLINTNLNLDQGLLKKFFRNIGRCYPRSSDKIAPLEKYCSRRKKKGSDHGSGRSGSEGRYNHSEDSRKGRSSSPPPPPSPYHRHPREPHDIYIKRTHPQERNHQYWTHSAPPRHYNHHSRYRRGGEPQHVARCEYECGGAFMENRSLSSRSSMYQFDSSDDGNKSNTSLRNIKTKKSKKSDTKLPVFNPQVYLFHQEEERPDNPALDYDPTDRKLLLCACERCGNVHQRIHKKHNRRRIDQKADRKVKRRDKYDSLLDQELLARLDEDFRREYDIYDASNLSNRRNKTCSCGSGHRYALSDVPTFNYSSDASRKTRKTPSKTRLIPSNPRKSGQYVPYDMGYNKGQSDLYSVRYKRNKYPIDVTDRDASYGAVRGRFDFRKHQCHGKYCYSSSDECYSSEDRKIRISEKDRKSDTKSKDKSKKGESYLYVSFFDRVFRKFRKQPSEMNFKEKFKELETRVNEIEKDLAMKCVKKHEKIHKDRKIKCRNGIIPKSCISKQDKITRELERKERKLKKKLLKNAWAYRQLEELERKKRLKEWYRQKKCEAEMLRMQRECEAEEAYFFTHSPMPRNEPDPKPSKEQKNTKDYFSSLRSKWANLWNLNFWRRRKQESDSDEPINDSSRSSRKPKTREVQEMKHEPTSFLRRHLRKRNKRSKGEKMSQKRKSGKGRYR